jgi:hypothetical protein
MSGNNNHLRARPSSFARMLSAKPALNCPCCPTGSGMPTHPMLLTAVRPFISFRPPSDTPASPPPAALPPRLPQQQLQPLLAAVRLAASSTGRDECGARATGALCGARLRGPKMEPEAISSCVSTFKCGARHYTEHEFSEQGHGEFDIAVGRAVDHPFAN